MENPVTVDGLYGNISTLFPSVDTVLWGLAIVTLLYALVHAIVFLYHWHKYNIAPGPFQTMTYLVYFSGIAVFSASILLSLVVIIS